MNIFIRAYLDRNLGDDLMIKQLCRAFPKYNFFLECRNPILYMPFQEIPNLKSTDDLLFKDFPENKYNAVILIGGSIFILDSKSAINTRKKNHIAVLKKLKKAGIKSATIGSNLGPFCSEQAKKTALTQLALSGIVTLRDNASYDMAKSSNMVKSSFENLYKFPDIVFSAIPQKYTAGNGMGICVYRDTKKISKSGLFVYYQKMAQTADLYIEKTGKPVRLIAFNCEQQNDLSGVYIVYNLMKQKKYAQIIAYIADESLIMDAIGESEVVIASRFHSLVISTGMGKAVLPVIYSNKTANFLQDIEYDGIRADYDKFENWDVEKMTQEIINSKNLLVLPRQKRKDLCEQAKGHFEALKRYIED